ncbi:ferredoxin [Arthrobacter sp. CAU 1506]|uniref:ferredoxin n=1 Tax=Arthrobacter sp. CAU 1506 TaxID=2560052 RepID=UPI0010AD6A81|nr:ferredoxin [Arthrobacter sp. CAU 1506]TJY70442.1 ferredoxin [Arthrobacter sp. CAU 1506]
MTGSLHIDWTRCDGRGLCTELLATLLTRDDWGYPISRRGDGIRGEVPIAPGHEEAAREAVILCPKLALTLRPPAKSS